MGGNSKGMKGLLRNEKGTVVVEVAVMFMVVVMIAAGYISFANAMRINTAVKIAAREAARDYSITNSASSAKERAKSELALAGIDPGKVDINISGTGKKRMVTISAKHGFYIPFAGNYTFDLGGGAEYILENNPEFK